MDLFYILVLIPLSVNAGYDGPSYRSSVMDGDKPILRGGGPEPEEADISGRALTAEDSSDMKVIPLKINNIEAGDEDEDSEERDQKTARDLSVLVGWLIENYGYAIVKPSRRQQDPSSKPTEAAPFMKARENSKHKQKNKGSKKKGKSSKHKGVKSEPKQKKRMSHENDNERQVQVTRDDDNSKQIVRESKNTNNDSKDSPNSPENDSSSDKETKTVVKIDITKEKSSASPEKESREEKPISPKIDFNVAKEIDNSPESESSAEEESTTSPKRDDSPELDFDKPKVPSNSEKAKDHSLENEFSKENDHFAIPELNFEKEKASLLKSVLDSKSDTFKSQRASISFNVNDVLNSLRSGLSKIGSKIVSQSATTEPPTTFFNVKNILRMLRGNLPSKSTARDFSETQPASLNFNVKDVLSRLRDSLPNIGADLRMSGGGADLEETINPKLSVELTFDV
ncbi:uncharacterized protein LOC142983747 isoform X1 [Anticarsia gemmatalis]|uniref:uncharacterized protein LOC142983747 isoform X1 n=1 Tax=Anticarsia gemmatalis TaxID=129554 RepID=UPI003F75A05C